jgi:hypothetical protein
MHGCNPFMPEVMAKVVENIGRARLAYSSAQIYVVYYHPRHAHILDRAGFLEKIGHPAEHSDIVIWRATSAKATN